MAGQRSPSCANGVTDHSDDDDEVNDIADTLAAFYDDFLLLFEVKTTKGILLFLLFGVLCSVITVAICVGFIWIHRYHHQQY